MVGVAWEEACAVYPWYLYLLERSARCRERAGHEAPRYTVRDTTSSTDGKHHNSRVF